MTTQEETIYTKCLVDESVTRLLRYHRRKKKHIVKFPENFTSAK